MADERRMSKREKGEASSSQADENNQIEENVHFLDLPENVLVDILSRLSLKEIFQSKSVAKTFPKIISEPYFSEVHLTRSPKTSPALIVIQDNDDPRFTHVSMSILDLAIDPPPSPPVISFRIDLTNSTTASMSLANILRQISPATSSRRSTASTSTSTASTSTSTASTSTSTAPSFHNAIYHHRFSAQRNVKLTSFISYDVTTVGSCNGLVCYYHTSPVPTYFVCNPLLGEYIILPRPTPSTQDFYLCACVSGFGFCPTSKTYKVIRFMSMDSVDGTWTTMAEIHTLGTKSWRRISCPARLPTTLHSSFDAHLNGSLHWIIADSPNPSGLICSFDLETEKFSLIPPPAHFKQDYLNKISWIRIGSMKGCLCVTYISEENHFTVWVMNKYGVKESWTKHFSIDTNFYIGLRVDDFYHPVKFSENGDLWLLTRQDSLVAYSPETTSFKEVSKLGTQWWTRAIPHVPSLVSLRNAVAVDKDVEAEGGITIQNMGPFNSLVMTQGRLR